MKLFGRASLILILPMLWPSLARADAVAIDFNDLPPGIIVTDQYSNSGAKFSLIPSPTEPGSPLPPPDGPTTWSLGPVNQIGVNGNSILVGPTTTGPFYDAQLDFSRPADYFSIMALDQDRLSDLRVQAYWQDEPLDLTVTATLVGDIRALPYLSGPVYRVELGRIGGSAQFDRVVFGGTEQFDNIRFNLVTTPESALAELRNQVTGIGPGNSLAMKVTQAQAYYGVSDIQATCAMLTAFVNEVEAQAGKKISRVAATKLAVDAQEIVTAIGCK